MRAGGNNDATRLAHSGCPERSSTSVVSACLLDVPVSTTSYPRSLRRFVARWASPRTRVPLSTCTRIRTPSGATTPARVEDGAGDVFDLERATPPAPIAIKTATLPTINQRFIELRSTAPPFRERA